MRSFHLQALAALCASGALATRQYTISNLCPLPITWYIGGGNMGTLATGANVTKAMADDFSWTIYTNANGGNTNSAASTKAGFYVQTNGSNTYGYYYTATDPTRFNTGIMIQPQAVPNNGYCGTSSCDQGACSASYQAIPTSFPHSNTAPKPPMYECDGAGLGYTVTFCPSGKFPYGAPTTIHPNGDKSKCLDVRGGAFSSGTAVQIYDCNGTRAQQWIITSANTIVQVGDAPYCLDAGSNPASGVGAKIWQCYNGIPAQSWYYTADKRIALTGKGQCLDLTGGSRNNGNQLQTWQCTNGNTNQIWTLGTEL